MREAATRIWHAGVAAVEPAHLVRRALVWESEGLRIEDRLLKARRIHIFAAGKAALAMASAAAQVVGDRLAGGVVITNQPGTIKGLEVYEGSHPVMDERSVRAAGRLLEVASAVSPQDGVLFLLSGGASALMELPAKGLTLAQMQESFRALLGCGAPIEAINCVRKHLSLIKGGRLAEAITAPSAVLVISDVIGDDLEAIGSAPLYFDRTTFADALAVVERYQAPIPDAVKDHLQKGAQNEIAETPKAPLDRVSHHLIGTNQIALKAAAQMAKAEGFEPLILTDALQGEAKEVAKALLAIALGARSGLFGALPLALIFGGECTVTLRGKGRGGRNQEFVLSLLAALKEQPGICVISGGSDGIDGASHAAGAVADGALYQEAMKKSLVPEDFLDHNNSTAFFEQAGGLIITGPSGTNVMDVGIILIKDEK